MEELEFEIDPAGKVTVRTKGIKGARCIEVAEAFSKLLGREESRELTDEYREGEVEIRRHQEQRQRR
jgi:hypothetical protein